LADAIGLVAPSRRSGLASDWIARLGIRARNADAAVLTLSGGNQQRVVLAKWLATDPKVLILDSPTVGVDVRNKQGIYELVRRLAALGCINALLTYYLRVVSIIVTIATSSIYYALLIYFTNAEEIYNLPDWWSGRITFLRFATASGVVKITLPIVVMIAVVLLTQYLMAWTRIGRQVYALGGNPEAASRVGVGVLRVQLLAYGYLGFLAAVAGFVQAGRVHQAVPTAMAG
jgi:ABC-type glucose/galactose transport system permease subunit